MAFKTSGRTLGLVAVLAIAPWFGAQTASAAETELMVMVTPYITPPTKQNGSQTMPMLGKLKSNPDSDNQAPSNSMNSDGASGKSRK